jgi:transposase
MPLGAESRPYKRYSVTAAVTGSLLFCERVRGTEVATLGRRHVISKETEAEILRLHYVEKWRKGTIAAQLHVHYSTVERVLLQNGVSPASLRLRHSINDPYIDLVRSTLEKYPTLSGTRLYHMAKERGYIGHIDHFRRMVRRYRVPLAEDARLRLSTLPAEQAQVDWASFGRIKIGNAERKLYAFVMVLSWSRRIFLQFYVNQGTANFQRGHIEAFRFFENRIPRKILYDNCKVVVQERVGKAILYNPELLALASHYRFEPIAVEPNQPEQKGRVERGIRFARSSFWPGREWKTLEDLNEQALKWCRQEADERQWVQNERLKVKEAFRQEVVHMVPAPDAPYPVYDRKETKSGKTQYIQFDLNSYSIPPSFVRTPLSIFATIEEVRICQGTTLVAVHRRSFDKGIQIENQSHVDDLLNAKRAGQQHRMMDRLQLAVPIATNFYLEASKRGHPLGRLTQELNRLLNLYGAAELAKGIQKALEAGRIHAAAVEQVLLQQRAETGRTRLPVRLHFQNNEKANNLRLPPQSLDSYGSLFKSEQVDEPHD